VDDVTIPLSRLTLLRQLKLNMNPLRNVANLTTLRRLRTLQLGGCEISSFPDDFGLCFSNLEEVVASQNGLSDIAPLAGLTSLRSLRAFMNGITTLPSSCLRSCFLTPYTVSS
jgi:Leucine-rich repeat (LRR) protein